MKKIVKVSLLAGFMILFNKINKRIRELRGYNTHTLHRSSPSNKCNKLTMQEEDNDQHIKQNTDVGKFNLLTVRELFLEFNVDIYNGAALKILLDTIKAKTYSNLVNDFYYSGIDVKSLLYKWDSTNCREYSIHPIASTNDGVYILQEDLDLYLRNRHISVQSDSQPEKKIELLIKYSFKEGYEKFKKRYESRINILKSDPSCTEVFDSIKSEMKSYLDFINGR